MIIAKYYGSTDGTHNNTNNIMPTATKKKKSPYSEVASTNGDIELSQSTALSSSHDEDVDEADPLVQGTANDMGIRNGIGSAKKTKPRRVGFLDPYRDPEINTNFMINWICLALAMGLMTLAMFVYWKDQGSHHQLGNVANNAIGGGGPRTPSRTRPPRDNYDGDNDSANKGQKKQGNFYFDPFAAVQTSNPLDMTHEGVAEYYGQSLVPPVWDSQRDSLTTTSSPSDTPRLGYMMQPDTVNGTVAFISEGDLYLSMWKTSQPNFDTAIPAMKLTTTVGNVRDPKINPVYPYLIAYTATYTGRRDIYLLDLRRQTHGSQPALRLTYWPTSSGVRSLVGWKDEGTTLVFAALSNEVSLPDVRMYELTLAFTASNYTIKGDVTATIKDTSIQHPQVMQTAPVPLAQALEGAHHGHEDCWYFTRFQQSSETVRYQGGTAESIWSWCKDHPLAVSLTTRQFNGTSKAPSLFAMHVINDQGQDQKFHYLLFLSDRGLNDDNADPNEWKPTTMNLWAIPLPEKEELSAIFNQNEKYINGSEIPTYQPSQFVQLTQISCDFGGMSLREYSLDPITQNVVLRIGADLHWMSADVIQQKLAAALPATRRWLEEKDNDDQDNDATPAPAKDAMYAKHNAKEAKRNKLHGPGELNKLNPKSEQKQRQAGGKSEVQQLQILVFSDFHEHQERLIGLDFPSDLDSGDVHETAFGTLAFLMTARGQMWAAPVLDEEESQATAYNGAGRNMPARKYRVVPGSKLGGAVRVLKCKHVPVLMEDDTFSRRIAIILATDPRSPTAEHGFYLIETQSSAPPTFLSFDDLPVPFVGGHNGGGSVRDGGLGSVMPNSVTVSPCGRRFAWVDTDGRICVMTLPLYKESKSEHANYTVLPNENELGEPLLGAGAELTWSPGGRYLAIEHSARNQFSIISVVDCGDPLMAGNVTIGAGLDPRAVGINIGRIVQVTPDRFNSFSPYWGFSTSDQNYYDKAATLAEAFNVEPESKPATTALFFLTDRDIVNKQSSPWGPRAPNPFFDRTAIVYALPLLQQAHLHDTYKGHFAGGGAMELFAEAMLDVKSLLKQGKETRALTNAPSRAPSIENPEKHFPQDPDIDFGPTDLTFARRAYRLANIPAANYIMLLSQAQDDGSFILVEKQEAEYHLKVASVDSFPSDKVEMKEVPSEILDFGISTSRGHLFFSFLDHIKVVPNNALGFLSLLTMDPTKATSVVSTSGIFASVWPTLEYKQMYGDAWRMMRDYFYDPEMTGINWDQIYDRYLPLVRRCAKREELDDALAQMASEVSALHVFVYGGEYSMPMMGDPAKSAHVPASFGVAMQRSAEWNGYVITSVPELDPDFSLLDGSEIYSPLSNHTLRLSGQRGLRVGDVIVAVNSESVMQVPDIHMLLRGLSHQSVRLDVLRLASAGMNASERVTPEPVIAVPIAGPDGLLYSAWEWKTRQTAKSLAEKAGFTVGYTHLQSMGSSDDIDSFYRGFFADFDKQAMIIDVRHNRGGNIDWWLLDVLQRKAWMYWTSRSQNATTGGLGWDEQFSFRGHLVVLIDEKTSSDAEGFSRGVSELGLGKLIGTRTWGGKEGCCIS
jgi:C-terminal processing protease CtpA/Prc